MTGEPMAIVTGLAPWLFAALCVVIRLRRQWTAAGYSWRAFIGDTGRVLVVCGERCAEYARRDEAPVLVRIAIDLQGKAPRLEAQRVGDDIVVAVPGRLVRFPAHCASCGAPR